MNDKIRKEHDMSEKPEALRLADQMVEGTGPRQVRLDTQWEAATELRRQHAENERLMTRLVEAKDKALRYDLDAAGISNREKEALELVELRAENERLQEALKKYGGHGYDCMEGFPDDGPWPCTCGFDEVLKQEVPR